MKLTTLSQFVLDLIKNPKSVLEFNQWYFYYRKIHKESPLNYSIPWMTFGAIKYLDNYIKKDMIVFEWGSGGSTLFFAERAKKVYSIEHDKEWFDFEFYLLQNVKNVDLKLILHENSGKLKNYREGYENKFFDNYVNSIDNHKLFDVIIVDGRQRNACFEKAIKHIKKNGIIIFDNFDRKYYQKSLDLIGKDFEIINFKGFFPFGTMQSLTTIFKKK